MGTNRIRAGATSLTVRACGEPEAGKLLSVSLVSAIDFWGSTSAEIDRPGWSSDGSTDRFQELPSVPSCTAVATGPAGALMVRRVTVPPFRKVTSTSGFDPVF